MRRVDRKNSRAQSYAKGRLFTLEVVRPARTSLNNIRTGINRSLDDDRIKFYARQVDLRSTKNSSYGEVSAGRKMARNSDYDIITLYKKSLWNNLRKSGATLRGLDQRFKIQDVIVNMETQEIHIFCSTYTSDRDIVGYTS